MQLAHFAAEGIKNSVSVSLNIDFMPNNKKELVKKDLNNRFVTHGSGRSAYDALFGLIPDKLINVLLFRAGISSKSKANSLKKDEISRLSDTIKSYNVSISDTRGFIHAQSTFGGIDFSELNPSGLTLKNRPNLGFCGEIVDVCGECGGYNIAWAISSGVVAARGIAKEL